MPRPKKEGASVGDAKKRSRTGCWPCKARKVKCGEEKPACSHCVKSGETCDYSIKLNWGGRSKKEKDGSPAEAGAFTFVSPPTSAALPRSNGGGREHVFSAQHIQAAPQHPRPRSRPSSNLPTPEPTSAGWNPSQGPRVDPRLGQSQQPLQPHDARHPPYGGLPLHHPYHHAHQQSPASADSSPPTSAPHQDELRWSPQRSAKRVKLSPGRGTPHSQASPVFAVPQYPPGHPDQSPMSTHYTPHSISSIVNTPATPSSSINSASPFPSQPATLQVQETPDLRRLSVKSLLSDPSDPPERSPGPRHEHHGHSYRTYGYDHGIQDFDIPHNDDHHVCLPKSPDMRRTSTAVSEASTSDGSVSAKDIAFEPGGYYAHPVPIKIPRFLEPLPNELLQNQMNLLYFHHFINHTGRIMVPHDCPENPFRGVLPQMAVRNTHLLHLLLAFSASHRARLLGHSEPANRIAEWMSDVLPALRQALSEPRSLGALPSDPTDPSSLAPLATAIMLASLEIMSPSTFAVQIPWQHHLNVARQMIVSKGGLHHLAQKADGARDKAIFFLSRWFAYLDVLGSLSGSKQEQPLNGAYLEDGGGLWLVNRSDEEIYQIDCFFGFSGRCIALLAQVAELAASCDKQRIDPITDSVKEGWRAEEPVRAQAIELKRRLEASATTVFRGCMHTAPVDDEHQSKESKVDQEVEEIYATNEAYHWAGLINLSRRVLGLPSTHPDVQHNVRRVLRSLEKIREGSTAEGCLLFPMFSAGCEAQTVEDRRLFMERLKAVEGWGMQHVGRASALMQSVWDTGRPWETMVDGEFLG
ncbi:hypothetical protein B0A50_05652 [Salinomyces thailandicus]|uniref:Zn(2)-C6 fungal-type domain-containing protein n=1 Tax=Salinomyces thailandicus TaxID=706561 RepID=A0A4U0TUM1_9PEZI|nr:hypothetical protein B0A50_05652 [Salinomyces thailandica]